MLIVPLHRSLNRANFPIVTAVLILINCFVFLFVQSRDGRVREHAVDYYIESHLGAVEFPAFREWLKTHKREPRLIELMDEAPDEFKVQLLQSDAEFVRALQADEVITPAQEGYAVWQAKRSAFEQIWSRSFTERNELRFSELDPGRIFMAMFLHGSFGHLFGNMIFLAVLGLLVEGALGPWLFLAVYLLGGLGGQLVSLAWRWGEHGSALGASGAIAALMGAYCALWGLRKVRVFYWFFVVFDYVRVPALALLPFWAGWELLNLLFNRGAHIGFDAHAGGILSGALLAFAVRKLGWERTEFLAEDEKIERRNENVALFDKALQHLGRLEIAQAQALLDKIDADEPGQLKVLTALYRCARYSGKPIQLDAAARRLFAFDARRGEDIRELRSLYQDYSKACAAKPRLPVELQLRLARLWLRIDADADAETMLRELAGKTPLPSALPAVWFEFAQRAQEGTPARRDRLEFALRQFPHSDVAPKAQFLLEQF